MSQYLQHPATLALVNLDHLHWSDEISWVARAQSRQRSGDGVAIIEETLLTLGRPITLAALNGRVWIARSDLLTLRQWAEDGAVLQLTLHDGTQYWVAYRIDEGPLEAETVLPGLANPTAPTRYKINTVRLVTVPAPA